MMRLLLITIAIFYALAASAQKSRVVQFYSYLQWLVDKELKEGDSLVIDATSTACLDSAWQAVIKLNGDSCRIGFYPGQVTQDTTPTEDIKPLNSFTTSKTGFIASLEEEKNRVRNTVVPSCNEEFFVQHRHKLKEYKLQKASGLYYRLKFNQSWSMHVKEK